MKERAKRKDSYKILRFIAVILSVICASSSLFICASAAWPQAPSTINVDYELPTLGYSQQGNIYYYRFCVECYYYTLPSGWSDIQNYVTYLYEIQSSSPFTISYSFALWGGAREKTLLIHPSITTGITAQVVQILKTGNTSWSSPMSLISNNYGTYWFAIPVNGSPQWGVENFVCYVLDDGLYSSSLLTSDYFIDTQFIQFRPSVPEQIQYRSSLPQPVTDTHNRYIVINDQLYWLSLYIDNLWVNPITGSVSQSNDNLTAVVTGNASDPTDGDLYYNYNVSITYQDKEYYCAQYNGIDYSFEDMCCPALVYTSSGSRLTISFDQLSGIYSSIQDILVDYRIYCSSFDLVSGEYIESVYSAQGQVGNSDININISCPDSIESIYCYGVEFQNPQNLPVNLGSVLWSYDLDFALWRTDIASKLDAIYALLSQSSVPTTSAPKDYGTAVSEVSDLPTYNASDVAGVLNSAVSDVNVNLSSGIEWGQGWFARIYHDIPELFIVVVLALAFGLVLLVLGKKKSDS